MTGDQDQRTGLPEHPAELPPAGVDRALPLQLRHRHSDIQVQTGNVRPHQEGEAENTYSAGSIRIPVTNQIFLAGSKLKSRIRI